MGPGKLRKEICLTHSQAIKFSEFYILRDVCRPQGELIFKSQELKGLKWYLESWKNQAESWKHPWNLLLKKGTNPTVCSARKRGF